MKGVDWGPLYNTYKDEKYDTEKIEEDILELPPDAFENSQNINDPILGLELWANDLYR